MILIDNLIHSFHIQAKTQLPIKTASYNLIEGNMKQIVKMLDDLSYSDGIDKEEWRKKIEIGNQARRGN